MKRLKIGLFGSPGLVFDGAPWPLAAPPGSLLLLALLAIRREPMTRALIASTLWPDAPDAEARSNLRRSVHLLRRTLPDVGIAWIVDDGGRLTWNHAEGSIDVAEFLGAIADSAQHADAVERYAGDLLAGLEHEWLAVERERIRLLFLEALHGLSGAARKRRDFAAAIRYAEQLLSHDDLREDAVRELIAARSEDGDRALALATFERFAVRLNDALGVEPMPETLALRDAIVAGLPLQGTAESPFSIDAFGRDLRAAPFIGRRGELDALNRAWRQAARGFGSTVLLGGAAGMGKSRLAAELSALVERQGGRVLVGLTAQPESAPYQALIAAAKRGLSALGRDRLDNVWAAALSGVLPEIGAIYRSAGSAEPLDAERSRTRLHGALACYFETIARDRPLLLVLEDLHWAGRDTIDALDTLARRGAGAPLLIVATFRSDDLHASSGLHALARRLRSEQRGARTMLGPLRPDEIGELVARTPIFDGAPAALPVAVARLSEGNPLFAWQLLRNYEETQRIPDADGAALTMREAIMSRVERLEPDARSVAEAAATVGRAFAIEMVAVAGGWSEAFVEDALEELVARHLVYASTAANQTYSFAHALIANAIATATPPAVRASRHRRVARRLALQTLTDRELLGDLARHWDLAGEPEKAYDAYVRTAEAALEVFARDEAALYARRAAELASGDSDAYVALALALRAAERSADVGGRRADLERLDSIVGRLGDAERFFALQAWTAHHAQTGDTERQRQTVEAMFVQAQRSKDDRRQIAALDARAYLHMVGSGIRDAEAPLAQAVALADAIGDNAARDRLSIRLANVQIRLGKATQAMDLLGRRRAALEQAGTPAEWLDLLNAELNCFFILEELDIGARAAEEQLALARRVGDVDSENRAHSALSYVCNVRGDAGKMREHSDLALSAFAAAGNGRLLSVALCNRGAAEFELGRISEALKFWERAGTSGTRAGASDVVANALIACAEAELLRGGLALAARRAAEALEIVRITGEERMIAEGLVMLGAARCALDERTAGLRELREGVERHRAASGKRALPHALTYLLEALVRAEELPAAAQAAAELATLDLAGSQHPARIHLALGAFHNAAGNTSLARQHFEHGRRSLRARLAALEANDAAAYRALPFSQALLAPARSRVSAATHEFPGVSARVTPR